MLPPGNIALTRLYRLAFKESFEAIRANFVKDMVFSKIEGIITRFNGMKTLPKKYKKNISKPQKPKLNQAIKAPVKRINTMKSTDIGNVPIKRKARTEQPPQDISNDVSED